MWTGNDANTEYVVHMHPDIGWEAVVYEYKGPAAVIALLERTHAVD
jgi:hypothetical protein